MKILIIKLSAIGDVIHTLPSLNAIRSAYPSAHITWLIEEAAAPMIIGHSALDRVIVSRRKSWIRDLRKGKWQSSAREAAELVQALRDTAYDLVFDFHALLKSGVLVGLSRGKRKIGFGRGMEHQEYSYLFLNERIKSVDMNCHAILRSLMMLDAAGIHSRDITYRLPIHADERKAINRLLELEGINNARPLICINPVAKWTTKLWPNARFAELAGRLSERYRTSPIFTGASEDKDTVQDILSKMKASAVDLTGKTSLKTLAALYETADVLISTDTGPMHLGAAVNTPVVALFGPTAPWRTGPMGEQHQVIRAGLPCSPCFKRQCPTCDCMNRIQVDQVLEGVARVLEDQSKSCLNKISVQAKSEYQNSKFETNSKF
jgi:heptosyltransferase-1